MANLGEDRTGVPGVIMISTVMGKHGPRAKLYVKPGRSQPSASISIGPEPRVLASSLDTRDLKRMAPGALAWVALNHAALTRFRFEGESLMLDEVLAFTAALKKI